MERPSGIMILVVLECIGGISGILTGLFAFGSIWVVLVGVISLILGFGLWMLNKWAFQVAMILSVFGIIIGIFNLPYGSLSLIIYVIIIYYLTQPEITDVFEIRGSIIFFLLGRIGFSVFVLFGLSILIFIIARVLPGDPARMALGPRAPQWAVDNLREELHLNDPIWTQYIYWVRDAFSGSLGRSLVTRRDVASDILEFLPATLELVIFAATIQIILAITLGMLAGRRANTWVDNVVRVVSYVGIAVPSFVFAIIFVLVFGYILKIFPSMGRLSWGVPRPPTVTGMLTVDSLITGHFATLGNALWHIILPGVSLSIGGMAQEARITRASVVENLNKDYIVSATSHGIPERKIMSKYLLKPSLIPTISIMGLDIASLIGNAFLVELIFNWPGFSRYGINAMLNKDLNAIVGVVMVIGLVFALGNIIVDAIIAYLDPRIRMMERAE